MSETMTTRRLLLEPLTPAHADALFPLHSDPATMRYWHTPPHALPADTAAMLLAQLRPPGARWWAVRLQADGRVIGSVGFHGTPVPGMGYLIHAPYWRQGLGSEAVAAALEAGFTSLALNRVELWIHEENVASQRLAERLAFRRQGQFSQRFPHATLPHETMVYGLRADEWTARSQQAAANPQREVVLAGLQPVLEVRDVAATAAYYVERLGFTLEVLLGEPPEFALVARGEWSAPAVRLRFVQADAPPRPGGALYITVGPGIDQLYAEYCARGVVITDELITQEWGWREFVIADLNGQPITFGAVA